MDWTSFYTVANSICHWVLAHFFRYTIRILQSIMFRLMMSLRSHTHTKQTSIKVWYIIIISILIIQWYTFGFNLCERVRAFSSDSLSVGRSQCGFKNVNSRNVCAAHRLTLSLTLFLAVFAYEYWIGIVPKWNMSSSPLHHDLYVHIFTCKFEYMNICVWARYDMKCTIPNMKCISLSLSCARCDRPLYSFLSLALPPIIVCKGILPKNEESSRNFKKNVLQTTAVHIYIRNHFRSLLCSLSVSLQSTGWNEIMYRYRIEANPCNFRLYQVEYFPTRPFTKTLRQHQTRTQTSDRPKRAKSKQREKQRWSEEKSDCSASHFTTLVFNLFVLLLLVTTFMACVSVLLCCCAQYPPYALSLSLALHFPFAVCVRDIFETFFALSQSHMCLMSKWPKWTQ